MVKKTLIAVALLLPALLLASHGEGEGAARYLLQTGRENDFWPRLFNFIIFAGLMYYLLAGPIKGFFKGRSEAIAEKLKEKERLLQEAKERKKAANAKLEEAKKRAEEIVADAKKEAKLLAQKIEAALESELAIMQKQTEEKMAMEEKKALRETVAKVLSENIGTEDIALNAEKAAEIISKKVA